MDRVRLRAVLGNHPHVKALKNGEVESDLVEFDFVEFSPTNAAFKPMVREQAFDVCEMAIVTHLMAMAHGKPLALLPATMLGRFQHGHALYNAARPLYGPTDLEGRRVGIRSFTTTTGAWVRGILANDYGVDLEKVHWITFEDPHVAEYRDSTERAPEDKKILQMLLDRELDAVLGEISSDARLKPLFGDPDAEARRWYDRHGVIPVNHLVVVTEQLASSRPDVVREVYRMLGESKARTGSGSAPDFVPFGIEAVRKPIEMIARYAQQQQLIAKRIRVDELFADTMREFR